MTRFQEISIKGFRRLADVQLQLRPLSVLIGANGIGKTSLLDVFSLLASSAQGSLNAALSELGGLSTLITCDRTEELALGISMEIEKDAQMQRYSLRIRPRGPSYVIEQEALYLHAAFPDFERLDFPPVAAGTLALVWRDKKFSKPLYANQLSEGTLRFLWLATLLQSPDLPAVTLIDEPEVSLHPDLLNLLVDLFREASHYTQLIVATHSDRLVRFLQPSELVALDSADDGTARLTWADQLDLDEWLSDYSLDEVWRRGRMGART